MKKVLITGDQGFVGQAFVRKLGGDWDITGVDLPTDARDFFRHDDTEYDLVIHLAAVVGGRATIEGAPLRVAVDLAIDAEAFQWALRTNPKHFVYYSSSAAYPIRLQEEWDIIGLNRLKLTEAHIDLENVDTPDSTYGWAKLTGEVLASYAEKEGLRTHVFRPFSGYGETQSLDYPFPSFIDRARRRADPFEIWGSGEQVRDWIHIDDVVDATLAAVDGDVQGPVNLCTGRPTSFNELASLVTREAGYAPEFDRKLSAPKGVHYRVGNPAKLHEFYTPMISLEEGIWLSLSRQA